MSTEKLTTRQQNDSVQLIYDELSLGNDEWNPSQICYYGPDSRTLLISGPIDEDTSAAFISQILKLSQMEPDEPITIHINSEGGVFSDTMAMYDALRLSPCPIVTLGMGECSSAGLILYMAGDLRLSYPSTRYFYHPVVVSSEGCISQQMMDGQHRLYTDQNKIIATLLRDRSKMSDEDWEQSFRDNVWATFSAEESLALNIVHKILKPKPKSITLGETKYGIER